MFFGSAGHSFYIVVVFTLARIHLLSLFDGELLANPLEYKSMVNALQYLTMMRPDIAFAIYLVSQFMNAPVLLISIVKHIFQYLHDTFLEGLHIRSSTSLSVIVDYSNANWDGLKDSC